MQISNLTNSPFAVCILPPAPKNFTRTVQYPSYTKEILDASGICYHFAELATLHKDLTFVKVLLTVGESPLPDPLKQSLESWVKDGGIWISVAGACGLEELLGVKVQGPSYNAWGGGQGNLGEGYLKPQTSHYATGHVRIPLHYFNGLPVTAGSATVLAASLDSHGRPTERAVLTTQSVGKGHTYLIAPDVPGTVVRIQQGAGAVTRDGVPAPDGTAPLADDALKTGDTHVLDWHFDRLPVPEVDGLQVFLEPIADQWRELLLRVIFTAIKETAACVPLLWFYPRNLSAIAHISLDTDHNIPEQGRTMLDLLNGNRLRATWCTILPGYAKEFHQEIKDSGHELAMHYDAVTDDWKWGRAQFVSQWRELTSLFNDQHIITNKNHYLRWEGDCEFWNWCIEHGIEIDQTKGASKTGEAGFNFGTCRPYFPVDFAGNKLNILELPTIVQDLEVFAPFAVGTCLLDAALRTHGILHLLFHPAHVDKPNVAESISKIIRLARDAGMEWWTAAEINYWERARRATQWQVSGSEKNKPKFSISSASPMSEATLLWLNAPTGKVRANGNDITLSPSKRWDIEFMGATLNLDANSSTEFTFV